MISMITQLQEQEKNLQPNQILYYNAKLDKKQKQKSF